MNDEAKRDLLALKAKDIFEEARDRLKIATDAESSDRTRARDDLKFCEGDQWDHDVVTTASAESPELTINLTDALVRRVVNNIKQQRPRGKCHPVGEGADIEVADVINGIGRHIEYRSESGIAYDTAAEMAVKVGWGYWRLISEYISPKSFDQDLRILPIRNIFTVYFDPASIMPTGSDANWCLITVKIPRTEYKMMYPGKEDKEWNDLGRYDDREDWESKEEIRLAEYFRIREIPTKLYLLADRTGNQFTRYQDEMPSDESLAVAGLTIAGERESSKRQVEWFRLNGTEVIERKILPGTYIPVIRAEGNAVNIDGKITRRGMVRAMQDPQRMVNYGEVAKIKRLGLTPQAPWVAAEGQLDGHPEWTDTNRAAYPVLTYKPVTIQTDQGEALLPPPQRQPPAQIEAGFSEFVQGMRTNLMAVAGMPNEPGADTNATVVSGRAIQKRQYLSDQSHYQYYDNLTLAIAHTWRIMLEWIPYYYSGQRIQRIIGEDGTPQLVTVNQKINEDGISKVKNDLSVGRYDVVMDTGPGYETKREEGAQALLDLINSKLGDVVAKTGADLVFRSLDYPYMQELADRIAGSNPDGLRKVLDGLPERARAIVQQLLQENQQLQQQLQQAGIEIKHGMDKEKLKSETSITNTLIKAKSDLARTNITSGTAMMNDMRDHQLQGLKLISQGEADARTNSGAGQQ